MSKFSAFFSVGNSANTYFVYRQGLESEDIMAKIQFNLTNKATIDSLKSIHAYRVTVAENGIAKASEVNAENKRFAAIKKPTKAQTDKHDENLEKISRKWAEANKKVNKAKNSEIKALVPVGLADKYAAAKFGKESDRKTYLDAIKNDYLLDVLGLECSDSQVAWFARTINEYIGVKLAGSKGVLAGHEVATYTKTSYNALLVACTYEILKNKGVIRD